MHVVANKEKTRVISGKKEHTIPQTYLPSITGQSDISVSIFILVAHARTNMGQCLREKLDGME